MALLIQTVSSGLLLGGIYALLSIGLSLIFGVVRVINFAQGELVMLGGFFTYILWEQFGLDPYISILAVAPALFLIGVVIQRFLLQPLQDRSANMKIFATFALFIVLQNLALLIWGATPRTVTTAYTSATIVVGNINISVPRLLAFAVALLFIGGLILVMKATSVGRALRAVAEDRSTAELMGVPVTRVFLIAFGTGAALAGVAGSVMAPFTSVFPTVGTLYTLIAFIVVILGGLGSMLGALVGGIVLGVVELLAGTYWDPGLQQVVLFGIFIAVLLIRPRGLFGQAQGTEEIGLR